MDDEENIYLARWCVETFDRSLVFGRFPRPSSDFFVRRPKPENEWLEPLGLSLCLGDKAQLGSDRIRPQSSRRQLSRSVRCHPMVI